MIRPEPIRFPEERTIRTANLVLRPIGEADLDDYFALCSDERVMRTWGTPLHRTIDDTRALLRLLDENFQSGKMVRWAIAEKGPKESEGRLIGDVGFWRFVPERWRAETGAKLAVPYWSRGYMSEALSAVIAFGFERMNLNSVEANVDPSNPAAIRLVEKAGMRREGCLRRHSYDAWEGGFRDTLLFSAVKQDWSPPCGP